MGNREKVIKEFADFVKSFSKRDDTYYKGLFNSVLALLKEQEAVKPLAKEDDSYECVCGAIVGWDELDSSGIVQTRLNYCPFCGKPIGWEGR